MTCTFVYAPPITLPQKYIIQTIGIGCTYDSLLNRYITSEEQTSKNKFSNSMKREEKRQKLHEGLLRMLYPPPPSPPSQEENDDEPFHILEQGLNLDYIPDELEEDRGSEKLTRAQRKRIRRKKLKEAASRCQSIIGPLLPSHEESDVKGVNVSTTDEEPQGVRENANETDDAESCSKQNKRKQRRMAKRLVGGSSKLTGEGNKS